MKIKESIIKNDKHKIHYYLFTKLKVNKKYEKLINIESREYFDIKNKKESKEKDDMIQIKNKLCYLLNKYKPLEISDFDENSIDSIQSILKEILSSLTLIENDDFIKLSAEYLFEKLKQFPDNYCQNLINVVEKDIKESIKEKEFENLSDIFIYLNFNRCEINNKKLLEIIDDYEKNIELMKIIKE